MTATPPPAPPTPSVDPATVIEKLMSPEALEVLRQAFPAVPVENLVRAREGAVECAVITMKLLKEGNFQWGLAGLLLVVDMLKQGTSPTQETLAHALLAAAKK